MNYFGNKIITSIDDIYQCFNKKEFRSPFRSTIPLIALFKSNQILDLGLINPKFISELKYRFEHPTPVIRGVGQPSYTDLMIEYTNGSIAIEAKRTERPYVKVGKWLNNSLNRQKVLEGWVVIINNHLGLKIDISEINDLPYQLIHRVASACSLKKQHTQVVYIGFDLDEKQKKYYIDCLTKFSAILDNKLDLNLICYKIEKLEEQKRLEEKWNQGERDLSQAIINGLMSDNLMRLSLAFEKKINNSK